MAKNKLKSEPAAVLPLPPARDIERVNITYEVKVRISEEERREAGSLMARLVENIQTKRAVLKEVSGRLRADIVGYETELAKNSDLLNKGYQMRMEPCVEEKDFNLGTVIITRVDTMQVVHQRVLTSDERQEMLPLPRASEEEAPMSPPPGDPAQT